MRQKLAEEAAAMIMGKESSTATQRTSAVTTPNKIHYTREQKHQAMYKTFLTWHKVDFMIEQSFIESYQDL